LDKAEAIAKLKDERRNAAVKIQARARSRAERKKFLENMKERQEAAVKIQAVQRGRAERKRLATQRPATVQGEGQAQAEAEAGRQTRLDKLAPESEKR
jgi:hypothetical protein